MLTTLRQDAIALFQAGVAAADPYQAVKRVLRMDAGGLAIVQDDGSERCGDWQKIHVIAFGKAACAMAQAARDSLAGQLLTGCRVVVTNYENLAPLSGFEVQGAGHPLPDAAGLAAAQRVAQCAESAQAGELLLVLVSGGGSALLPCPVPGLSLADKIATTQQLLACGATINETNCVRKHLSQLKGGGLARLAFPADVHALVLSDVLGDDLSAIASGPTVADATTFADAIAVCQRYAVWDKLPVFVQDRLQAGERGAYEETLKPGDPRLLHTGHTLVGSNALSLAALAEAAKEHGYHGEVFSQRLCGEARQVADDLAQRLHELYAAGLAAPHALLAGGETTVTLRGTGKGGRNQEFALAFALAAERLRLPGGWTLLSGGSDGRDGPTDAAGGIVDAFSLARMRAAGVDPQQALDNNDAYTALAAAGDLLCTGATGTNVADLQALLVCPFT